MKYSTHMIHAVKEHTKDSQTHIDIVITEARDPLLSNTLIRVIKSLGYWIDVDRQADAPE